MSETVDTMGLLFGITIFAVVIVGAGAALFIENSRKRRRRKNPNRESSGQPRAATSRSASRADVPSNAPATKGSRVAEVVLDCVCSENRKSALDRLWLIRRSESTETGLERGHSPSDSDRAIMREVAQWALARDPKNPAGWCALYIGLESSDVPYEQAKPQMISALDQIVTLAPESACGWFYTATFHGSFSPDRGTFRKALGAYDRALQLEPKNRSFLECKAMLLDKYEDYRGAIQCYENLIRLHPDGDVMRYRRAITELQELLRF